MAGQLDNKYGDRDNKPLTGVAAPTTSTVGYLGQVMLDTDGVKWECLNVPMTTWNQTTGYIWALADKDVFPSANTEYISHYDGGLGELVYKALIIGMTPNATTANAIFNTLIDSGTGYTGLTYTGTVDYATGVSNSLPISFSTDATPVIQINSFVNYAGTPKIQLYFKCTANMKDKPFRAIIKYIK